ncbi:MAG: AlpA family transcriptional regulator [Candidatus Accumulibacter sp.]|uniref:helix-turn-helix transcriptional regulator n=1 Tax=Betaproteobacteria TaxID=28216 RepID=UPI001ACA2C6C|nr:MULTISPECIES: AlpA family transcriptional regulator [Betaproteobacteria]MBN8438459.1 AlpA family transcriptional regulator [Accumulibacter sp.]MBN8473167.1 AlpA family transcriptional regulator [Sulfuritalea sp.]
MNQLPEVGFLRLPQIIGDTKRGIPPIVPVSKSTWWAGVKSGRYPLPVKLSPRTTAWPVESIRALIEQATASGKSHQPLAAS